MCHHHCPAFMPLMATGTDYMPIFHLGAVGGIRPPFWDQHDEFGDTNMLVVKPEEGASLARALGRHWMVLMMRHGVTVAGTSVRDCVFRSVFSARNAEYQVRAMTIGPTSPRFRRAKPSCAARSAAKTTGLDALRGNIGRCALPKAGGLAGGRQAAKRTRARPSDRAKPRRTRQRQAAAAENWASRGGRSRC